MTNRAIQVNPGRVPASTPGIGSGASGAGGPDLCQRLREAGLVVLQCDERGELSELGASPDWMRELLVRSPLFRGGLRQAATVWAEQEEPRPIEALRGCWLCATERLERRKRCGYNVAVIITTPLLEGEELAAMCQASRADLALCTTRLRQLPPAAVADVPRLSLLWRTLQEEVGERVVEAHSAESLSQQLAESYEEINLLYSIAQTTSVAQPPERFVAAVCMELLGTLPYAWIGAQLADDPQRLKGLSGSFMLARAEGSEASRHRGKGTLEGLPLDASLPSPLMPSPNEEQLRQLTRRLLSTVQDDSPLVLEPGRNKGHLEFAGLGRTIAVHPVTRDGRVLGLLIAAERQGHDPQVSSADIKLMGAVATNLAIFLENAALYDDLNAMFLGTLEAITATIDAKDRYTCGHSLRVAHLTQMLGKAVALEPQQLQRVHIAGLVHDVGKIGVPEAVLTKASGLTEEEFSLIRKHPEIGHRILKDIPQLDDVLPGVLHHHERWDGKGYPHGLKGEAIPFVARLVALADTFDAMSTNRAYRGAMSRAEVLTEILRSAGTQFDPRLARTFVTLDFSQFDRMVVQASDGAAESITQQVNKSTSRNSNLQASKPQASNLKPQAFKKGRAA